MAKHVYGALALKMAKMAATAIGPAASPAPQQSTTNSPASPAPPPSPALNVSRKMAAAFGSQAAPRMRADAKSDSDDKLNKIIDMLEDVLKEIKGRDSGQSASPGISKSGFKPGGRIPLGKFVSSGPARQSTFGLAEMARQAVRDSVSARIRRAAGG